MGSYKARIPLHSTRLAVSPVLVSRGRCKGPTQGHCGFQPQNGHLRSEAIDHVRVFQGHQVQPAAAPLSACGHPPLMAAVLQQVSNFLQRQEGTHVAQWDPHAWRSLGLSPLFSSFCSLPGFGEFLKVHSSHVAPVASTCVSLAATLDVAVPPRSPWLHQGNRSETSDIIWLACDSCGSCRKMGSEPAWQP